MVNEKKLAAALHALAEAFEDEAAEDEAPKKRTANHNAVKDKTAPDWRAEELVSKDGTETNVYQILLKYAGGVHKPFDVFDMDKRDKNPFKGTPSRTRVMMELQKLEKEELAMVVPGDTLRQHWMLLKA
jgi:hypothetical protein